MPFLLRVSNFWSLIVFMTFEAVLKFVNFLGVAPFTTNGQSILVQSKAGNLQQLQQTFLVKILVLPDFH